MRCLIEVPHRHSRLRGNDDGDYNMTSNRPRHWLFCALLLSSAAAGAATITVRPDRDPVTLEESFQLIFESEGAPDGAPDFSPLEKDFQILSQSSGSNISIHNARMRRSKSWTLTVFARREGLIPIPPIAFGKDRSPADSVTVGRAAGPGGVGARPENVFVELSLEPEQVYVQQQLLAKVKIFYRAVTMANATLTEPALESGRAIVEYLEKDRQYEATIANRRYQVLERTYAVYPQESGALRFKPVILQGQASRRGAMRDPFGPAAGQLVKRSPVVELTVKPIPPSFPGSHWLPAMRAQLAEQWSTDPATLQVDEPVTRTLGLTVDGLTASQLPVLVSALDDGFRQYPDQPTLENRKSAGGSVGVRQEKTALIPLAAGEFVLPEISLPWWNTVTDRLEYALLPERTITVLPAGAATPVDLLAAPRQAADAAADNAPDIKSPAAAEPPATDADAALAPLVAAGVSPWWQWASCALAAVWLLTLSLWFHARRRARRAAARPAADNPARPLAAIKRACQADDPVSARSSLIAWAGLRWPGETIMNLDDVGAQCQPRLAAEIAKLSLSLYGRERSAWRGRELWSALLAQQERQRKAKPGKRGKLEPLHRL